MMKYDREKVKKSIDDFWHTNHYPPTIREIMVANGISSTSVASNIINRLSDVKVVNGHIIPGWVDRIFEI